MPTRPRESSSSPILFSWNSIGTGIIAGDRTFEVRTNHVVDKNKNSRGLENHSNRRNQVPDSPAATGLVGIDAARHAEQAGHMHEVKREVKADQKNPEMPAAELFAQHAARHLRKPVIERAENREKNSSDDDVMEVGDDKVGIV